MAHRSDAHAHVSEDRLRQDIRSTAEFGAVNGSDGQGRTVLPGTNANKRAREFLVRRLEDAELDVSVDAVGNIVGRWVPENVDPNVPAVAAGSHLDSVPEGGIFDGVLGVYAALEAVRAMKAAEVTVTHPVDVVCFTEEEGTRFSDGVLGSSVAIGESTIRESLALTDEDGVTLETALSDIGFRGSGRIDASEWDSWLELHVEQGERLETADIPVGVVTMITGTTRCQVTIEGETDHAGTTPMDNRTDAMAAASELILEVESSTRDITASTSETAVGTVGRLDVQPNAVNVIPGEVTAVIDIRDIEYGTIEDIVSDVRARLDSLESDRGVETTFTRPYDLQPIPMSDRCEDAFQEGAKSVGVETMELHSGAGHDTMSVAKVTDSGMIFAPSQDGISHSPLEWTDWSDCAAATRVLAAGLTRLASQ